MEACSRAASEAIMSKQDRKPTDKVVELTPRVFVVRVDHVDREPAGENGSNEADARLSGGSPSARIRRAAPSDERQEGGGPRGIARRMRMENSPWPKAPPTPRRGSSSTSQPKKSAE
jgi:hypothetical protein